MPNILIRPSIPLIIYAIIVEGNIDQLFQAAAIPGILATVDYLIVIGTVVRLRPDAGPVLKERWSALRGVWSVAAIFGVVMGGIYSGAFMPTEGAGIGATGTFPVALFYGGTRWQRFLDALIETAAAAERTGVVRVAASVF